jgi:hypothetical protein
MTERTVYTETRTIVLRDEGAFMRTEGMAFYTQSALPPHDWKKLDVPVKTVREEPYSGPFE